jgi:hypothetical protein
VPAPAQVNFRLPDNPINAGGWTTAFDAARRPAWTTLSGADATGFTLTGTGAATVTTPPLFPAGKAYKAAGVTVTAAPDGRLTIPVDLGTGSTAQVFIGALSNDFPGTVPATLSLTLGAPATFGALEPGVEREYTASTIATVTSTGGDAALSVSDRGRLTNGAFLVPPARSGWRPRRAHGPRRCPVTPSPSRSSR